MKKIFTLLVLFALVGNIYGQRKAEMVKKYDQVEMTKADTLMPASFASGTPALYTADGGGYVVGNNSYGDVAKAQEYAFTNFSLSSVAFWFGAKEIATEADTVILNVYDMDGTGTDATGQVAGPGTVVSTVEFLTDAIDTAGGYTVIDLVEPIALDGNYAIGFDMSKMVNDTIGLISTSDGDATTELSWEQWGDGSWYTFVASWPLAFDLGIFPIGEAIPTYDVTFNVDMRPAIDSGLYVIGTDSVVSITGTMTGWTEPIAGPEYIMEDADNDSIYTVTLSLTEGDHEYKYFKNEGWSNGEWEGGDNRMVTIASDTTFNDVWGVQPVGILDRPAAIEMNIYPNPSNGIIQVEAQGANKVTVISAIGQVISSTEIQNQGTINLSDQPSGVYFVRVQNGNRMGVRRVVIE